MLKATITDAKFDCPGQVTVKYDLNLECGTTDVTLYYSTENNPTVWLIATSVSGTGSTPGQSSGTNKEIVWNNVADGVVFGNFYFKIEYVATDCPSCMSGRFPFPDSDVTVPITVRVNKDAAGNWVHEQGTGSTTTTTLTFLTYNLGADPSLPPKEQMKAKYAGSDDIRVYGGCYQWGRKDPQHTLRCATASYPQYFSNTSSSPYSVTTYNPSTDTTFVWHSSLPSRWWANGEVNNSNLWGNGCIVGTRCPNVGVSAGVDACPTTSGCFGGNSSITKRPNDPCPPGYRVPTQHEWALLGWEGGSSTSTTNDFTSSISANVTVAKSGLIWVRVRNGAPNTFAAGNMCGYAIYTQTEWNSGKPTTDLTAPAAPEPLLFLPAAGIRSYYGAALLYVGTNGYYWSSTVESNDSYSWSFSFFSVNTDYGAPRASGYSLRCVAE